MVYARNKIHACLLMLLTEPRVWWLVCTSLLYTLPAGGGLASLQGAELSVLWTVLPCNTLSSADEKFTASLPFLTVFSITKHLPVDPAYGSSVSRACHSLSSSLPGQAGPKGTHMEVYMTIPKLFSEKAVQSNPHYTCFSHTLIIIGQYQSFTSIFSFMGEKEYLSVAFTGTSLITSEIKHYLTLCVSIAISLTRRIHLFLT